MDIQPERDEALASLQSGQVGVLWTELVADLETPVSAFLKLASGRPNSFLLESVEGGSIKGRYSFIGFSPDVIWRCRNGEAEINRTAETDLYNFNSCEIGKNNGALASLRALENESRIALPTALPPMAAGLVGYLAYDMVRLAENIPNTNPDKLKVPDSIFLRPTLMAVFDSLKDSVTLITPIRPCVKINHEDVVDAGKARLQSAVALLSKSSDLPRASTDKLSFSPRSESNCTLNSFRSAVRKCIDYIKSGDIFQVVISQRFRIPFALAPISFYRALRRLNPSPFLFFLDFGGFSIIGSSPEILVRVRDKKITLRPLAGTRKRGENAEEDKLLSEQLLNDEKERAEHLMLLDLGRNDVGRVANIGTVKVTEKFKVEYYSHVMHLASNVEGQLNPSYDPLDAVLAGFPAGTVSGAPKVRAMEIIDEIESESRGVYGGCIGYFGANGDVDTCIALRTAVIKDGNLFVQAGAGIVADSDPEAEYQETINKASALMRAAAESIRYEG